MVHGGRDVYFYFCLFYITTMHFVLVHRACVTPKGHQMTLKWFYQYLFTESRQKGLSGPMWPKDQWLAMRYLVMLYAKHDPKWPSPGINFSKWACAVIVYMFEPSWRGKHNGVNIFCCNLWMRRYLVKNKSSLWVAIFLLKNIAPAKFLHQQIAKGIAYPIVAFKLKYF